jgi:alpha-glucosidase
MLVRWTQLSAFAPFFRNHAAMWAKNQEPWAFDEKTLSMCRDTLKMRYALMPYIYSEFIRSACHEEPFIRGLFYDHKEAAGRLDDDQFLCGRALLVAPVVKAATHGRMVYLPSGEWLKVVGSEDGLTGERIQKSGDAYIDAGIDEIPLFLKAGSLIPMTDPAPHIGALSSSAFRLLGFTDSTAQCEILLDDGETKYNSWESYPKVVCSVTKSGGKWSTNVSFHGTAPRPISLELELWSSDGKRNVVSVNL